MGWQTTITILNDAIHELKNDPEFGRRLELAILKASAIRHGERNDIRIGNHLNGCMVIESHHADQTALIAAGGNHATKVFQTFGDVAHHTEYGQEQLLRDWANKMGFRLVRKKDTPVRIPPGKDPAHSGGFA